MKINKSLALIATGIATLISTSAMADSVSGTGGLIPASGTGGGGTWQTVLPPNPFVSTVNVPVAVASIQSVVLNVSTTHTWIGDLQVVLFSPSGQGYNIFVRPGSTAGSVGNSGDLLVGQYTFVDPVGGNPTLPTVGNAVPGTTYAQSYNGWTNGNLGINNVGLNSVSGASGNWTLRIYDWAGGDTGALATANGWTLNYTPVPAPGAVALLGLAGLVGSRRRRS